MADDNKIQFDIELNQSSIDSSFSAIDERSAKSAKTSAAVFGEYFQKQEQDLQASISRIVSSTKTVAEKTAKESAAVFEAAFKKQEDVYKASVKQNMDNALKALTGGDGLKKSAQESASVFEEAFAKLEPPAAINPKGVGAAKLSLTELASGYFLATQAVMKFKDVAEAAFNFVLRGEAEIKLEKRFQALAEQAGVAADVLENKLSKAARGLLEDDQYFQIASEAFVRIGKNAERLPEVLDVARKSYKVFGGEVSSIADQIVSATETGNKRSLRSIGLYTDLEGAVKAYAMKLGTVPQLLTEQQTQQARLNAILETAQNRFKNVSSEIDSNKDAFTRAKVAYNEYIDGLAAGASKVSGGLFKGFFNSVADFFEKRKKDAEVTDALFAKPKNAQELQKVINVLSADLDDLNKRLQNLDWSKLTAAGSNAALKTAIEDREATLKRLRSQMNDFREVQKLLDQRSSKIDEKKATQVDAALQAEFIRRRQELVAKVQELNNQQNQSEVQLLQEEFQRKQTRANLESLYFAQRTQATEQFEQQKAQLEKFYADNGVVDAQLRNQGREALEMAHLNKLLQLQNDYAEKKKQIFSQTETEVLSVGAAFNNIALGMEESAQELAVNAAKSFKAFGKSMFQSIGSAAGNAFAAFGQAIATGEDALQAFGKSLLNSLGQAAIQMGSMFILQGIAYTYAGLANGVPLIAAGAALAAIGGVLAASQGASPSGVSGGGVSGGGFTSDTTSPISEPIAPEDTKPTTPTTAVNLTINGNVLDRRQTGLEIAQILEEQFSEQGLVVRG